MHPLPCSIVSGAWSPEWMWPQKWNRGLVRRIASASATLPKCGEAVSSETSMSLPEIRGGVCVMRMPDAPPFHRGKITCNDHNFRPSGIKSLKAPVQIRNRHYLHVITPLNVYRLLSA